MAVPYRFVSPHSEAPFARNAKAIAELYFKNARIDSVGEFTVLSENNVGHLILQEIQTFVDENGNGRRDPGEISQNYDLMIFVSKDASFLRDAFEKTAPGPHDVCIYLEDNTGDTFSGTTAFAGAGVANITVGSGIQRALSEWLESNEAGGFDEFKALESRFGFSTDLSRKQMRELVETGKLVNTKRAFAIGTIQVLNTAVILGAPVYSGIGTFVLKAAEFLRDHIKFRGKHWDPEAESRNEDTGELEDTLDFQPFLFQHTSWAIEELSTLGEAGAAKAIELLRSGLNRAFDESSSSLAAFGKAGLADVAIPDDLLAFMKRCRGYLRNLMDELLGTAEQIVPWVASMSTSWINILNALYCGLWNSLVEAVLGIVDLFGRLLKAVGWIGEGVKSAQTTVPEILEFIDEAHQTLARTDLIAILKKAFSVVIEKVQDIEIADFVAAISVERVAYFCGALTGFAIEILVGIFWSGGLDGVRATLTKFGTLGADVIGYVQRAIGKVTRHAEGFSTDGLIAILRLALEVLSKGADEIARLIADVFAALRRGFKSAEELIRIIMDIFKWTRDEVAELHKHGFEFVGYTRKHCTICRIS